jgi:hypothetical protein
MKDRYLEVTYRRGKPLAAYLYLPRQTGDTIARVVSFGPFYKVDYTAEAVPIGVEVLAPGQITLETLNEVLAKIGQPSVTLTEVAPLVHAA